MRKKINKSTITRKKILLKKINIKRKLMLKIGFSRESKNKEDKEKKLDMIQNTQAEEEN